MASPMQSFDALSPRYVGFDAFFRAEIQPIAPGLGHAPRAGPPLPQTILVVLAVAYLAAAPAVLLIYPEETASFRPWALASGGFLLAGVLFAVFGHRGHESRAMVSAGVWADVRGRLAGFFGLSHAPVPASGDLAAALARAPAPPAAFKVELRVVGAISRGAAAGVEVDLMEGAAGGRHAAILAFGFPDKTPGLAALLDDGAPGVDRAGLEPMAVDLPARGDRPLSGYAETPAMARRIADPAFLDALAARRAAIGADAVNLAVVDDAARLYLVLSEPWLLAADSPPGAAAVGEALADYDAILRFAETLAPLFQPETAAP